MIIVRAPLRISFVGGGTDLATFYRQSPGRVLSGAIDKYVYVTIAEIPFKKIAVRYAEGERVDHPRELKHKRIREALLDLGLESHLEIGTFSNLPGQTGLGSSSAFSVALIKGLNLLKKNKIDTATCAEGACRLEIDLVGEPIGKQDQYASAFGGINVIQFNPDESVTVEPQLLGFKERLDLENNLVLFFTGITREAASVLTEQKQKTTSGINIETLKKMADSVSDFKDALFAGDFKRLGAMLHEGWLRKKSLASNMSNPAIDDLYDSALASGAWGGKILGAGGGGCLLFVVDPQKRGAVEETLRKVARKHGLSDADVIPFSFVHSGVEVVTNSAH